MRRWLLTLVLAVGACMALPAPAQAWDAWDFPEPGAAEGYVVSSRLSNMAPIEDKVVYEYEYDAQGRVTKSSSHYADSVQGNNGSGSTIYTYDDQGRLASSENQSAGGYYDRFTYEYRGDGTYVTWRESNSINDGEPYVFWTEFPENPLNSGAPRVNGMSYGFHGLINYEMTDGHVTKVSSEDGQVLVTYTYTFDGQGRVTKATGVLTEAGRDRGFPSQMAFEYAPDGGYTYVEGNEDGHDTYVFDAKGLLTRFEMKTNGDDNEYYNFTRLYEYDEAGNSTRVVDPYDDTIIGGQKMGYRIYTYDRIPSANEATVTFDANGHGTAPSPQVVEKGGAASEPKAPEARNWEFGGWYADRACTTKWDFSDPVETSMTLYAKWTQVKVPVSDDPSVQYVYRLYNQWSGEHLLTTDANEANTCVGSGWDYEDVGFNTPATSDKPIYRLLNPYTQEHLYTADKGEYDTLCTAGWKGEGVKLFGADDSGTPVYRLRNPYEEGVKAHLLTTDANERATLLKSGYEDEDIAFYGLK